MSYSLEDWQKDITLYVMEHYSDPQIDAQTLHVWI